MADQVKDQTSGKTSDAKDFKFMSDGEFFSLPKEQQSKQLSAEESQLTEDITKKSSAKEQESTEESETSEVSSQEETTEEQIQESDAESEEESTPEAEQAPDQVTELKVKLEALEQLHEEQSRNYKELEREFHRRNQEYKKTQQETSSEEAEIEKELAEFRKQNPKAAKLIERIIDQRSQDKIQKLEERVHLREQQFIQKAYADDVDSFRKGALSSLEPEASAIIEENPAKFNDVLLREGTILRELEKELFLRHRKKVLDAHLRWEKTNPGKTTSNKKDVEKAQIGKKSVRTTEPIVKTLEDFSPEEIDKMSAYEMEKYLPHGE